MRIPPQIEEHQEHQECSVRQIHWFDHTRTGIPCRFLWTPAFSFLHTANYFSSLNQSSTVTTWLSDGKEWQWWKNVEARQSWWQDEDIPMLVHMVSNHVCMGALYLTWTCHSTARLLCDRCTGKDVDVMLVAENLSTSRSTTAFLITHLVHHHLNFSSHTRMSNSRNTNLFMKSVSRSTVVGQILLFLISSWRFNRGSNNLQYPHHGHIWMR